MLSKSIIFPRRQKCWYKNLLVYFNELQFDYYTPASGETYLTVYLYNDGNLICSNPYGYKLKRTDATRKENEWELIER